MKSETSLYLDILRFGAAMSVFLSHLGGQNINAGMLWQFGAFGSAGVIVFFVLSGYVVSFVTYIKETDRRSYVLARVGRLYSVAVPALLLTILIDALGRFLFPSIGSFGEGDLLSGAGWRLAVSALFLNEVWSVHILTGNNGPYWSLSYEVAYYALFGVAIFVRGYGRWLVLGVIALLAGPRIMALLPAWLAGAAAYRLSGRQVFPVSWRWPMFIGTTTLLIAFFVLLSGFGVFSHSNFVFYYSVSELIQVNVLAFLLSAHLVCFDQVCGDFSWINTVKRPIRAAAATTFGLYLYHMPILIFVTACFGPATGSMGRTFLIAGFTLAGSLTLARFTEPQKKLWQRAFGVAFDRIGLFARGMVAQPDDLSRVRPLVGKPGPDGP